MTKWNTIFLQSTLFLLFLLLFVPPRLQAQSVQHKVQDEETLFSIAKEYHITVQQLKKWNNLSGNTISIGQVLIIKKAIENHQTKSDSYTVKSKDTLFSIAKNFGVSVAQLQRWNNLSGTSIGLGQVLKVRAAIKKEAKKKISVKKTEPKPTQKVETAVIKPAITEGFYIVKSGDTLFRIAQMHGMEVEKLKTLNELNSNNIHVGQQLQVDGGSLTSLQTTSKAGAVINYTLKQGMELSEVLNVFEMTEKQFMELNPEMKANYLNKGQVVRIVVPKTPNATAIAGSDKLTVLGATIATEYGTDKKGTVTTNGELYNPKELTAAHETMAIGSVIFIKNKSNNRGIIIRINDRITQTGLKLSQAAWQALGLTAGTNQIIMYRINE